MAQVCGGPQATAMRTRHGARPCDVQSGVPSGLACNQATCLRLCTRQNIGCWRDKKLPSRSPELQTMRSERCVNYLIARGHPCNEQQRNRRVMYAGLSSGLTCHHGRQIRQTALSPHPRSWLSGLYGHPPWTSSTPGPGSKVGSARKRRPSLAWRYLSF